MKMLRGIWGVYPTIAFVFFFCFLPHSNADTLRVGTALDPSVPGNFITVQTAIDSSDPGDIIMIASGNYPESINTANHDQITIRGAGANLTRIQTAQIYSTEVTILDLEVVDYIYLNGASDSKILNLIVGKYIDLGTSDRVSVVSSTFGSYGRIQGDDVVLVDNVFRDYLHFKDHSGYAPNRSFAAGNTIYTTRTVYAEDSSYRGWEPVLFQGDGIFQNNLIVRKDEGVVNWDRTSNTSNWVIRQNTYTAAPLAGGRMPSIGATWKNNIVTTDGPPVIDKNGNLVGNPGFTDSATDDYTLGLASTAIDAGTGLDVDGSPADLGYLGGASASINILTTGSGGQPVVGPVIVQPDPIAPGEPIRIRFNARTN